MRQYDQLTSKWTVDLGVPPPPEKLKHACNKLQNANLNLAGPTCDRSLERRLGLQYIPSLS